MRLALPGFGDSPVDLLKLIKVLVYSFLLINFALYIRDDWVMAAHTMRNGGDLLAWTGAFATTIDESAWMVLLILFELETHVLSDQSLSRGKALLMTGVRFLCYLFLAHTLYAYGNLVYDLSLATPIEGISNLCQLLGSDVSYAYNLVYTEVNAANCASLSPASEFFFIDPPEYIIVNDGAGLVIERQLAWVDFIEAVVWLLILLAIELNVQLQDRGVAKGLLISSLNMSKLFLYTLLWGAIAYWIYRGHWMFAWDEFVWIAGFIAIEMNVVEWRREIIENDQAQPPIHAELAP